MASCEHHEASFARKSLSALPGILLLTGVAVFSWFITPRLIALHPFMKSLNLSDFIVAIILGMLICNTVGVPAVFRDGLRFSTTLTKTGIVVMGCKYSFAGLIKTGSEAIIIISVFLFTSAIILMWLSRRLSMSPSLGACLAAGLSICGVSACVAIAPAVRAKNEDIAYTIAVVLMFGLLALFVFP
ncbi:YeiH family protein, partial [Desulfovibrio piger]